MNLTRDILEFIQTHGPYRPSDIRLNETPAKEISTACLRLWHQGKVELDTEWRIHPILLPHQTTSPI